MGMEIYFLTCVWSVEMSEGQNQAALCKWLYHFPHKAWTSWMNHLKTLSWPWLLFNRKWSLFNWTMLTEVLVELISPPEHHLRSTHPPNMWHLPSPSCTSWMIFYGHVSLPSSSIKLISKSYWLSVTKTHSIYSLLISPLLFFVKITILIYFYYSSVYLICRIY